MEKACEINQEITTPRQAIHLLIQTNLTHKRIIEKRTTVTELQNRIILNTVWGIGR